MKIDNSALSAMEKALTKAKATKSQLDSLDDKVSASLSDVEAALQNLKLGFVLSTVVVSDCEMGEFFQCLSFEKWGGDWRLLYKDGVVDNESIAKPATDCNRELRVTLLNDFVPKLVIEVAQSLEERISDRKEAIRTGGAVTEILQRVAR